MIHVPTMLTNVEPLSHDTVASPQPPPTRTSAEPWVFLFSLDALKFAVFGVTACDVADLAGCSTPLNGITSTDRDFLDRNEQFIAGARC